MLVAVFQYSVYHLISRGHTAQDGDAVIDPRYRRLSESETALSPELPMSQAMSQVLVSYGNAAASLETELSCAEATHSAAHYLRGAEATHYTRQITAPDRSSLVKSQLSKTRKLVCKSYGPQL